MSANRATALAYLAVVVLTGCAPGASDDEAVGSAQSEVQSENALAINALAINALAINALAINALAINALEPAAMTKFQDPGSNGDLARELLSYTVGCAL